MSTESEEQHWNKRTEMSMHTRGITPAQYFSLYAKVVFVFFLFPESSDSNWTALMFKELFLNNMK